MSRHKKKSQKNLSWQMPELPTIVFILGPFFLGLFYEPLAALSALLLILWLGTLLIRRGSLRIPNDFSFWALTVLAAGYLLSAFWGVDKGLAPIGFVKFLPLPLFLLCCGQMEEMSKQRMLRALPYGAACMTVLSFLMGQISSLYDIVFEGRRLAGFFQYSGSFALYLLMGILILWMEYEWRGKEIFCLLVLFVGLAYSGSRTTMILLGLFVLGTVFFRPQQALKRYLPLALLALVLVWGLIGDPLSVGRFIRGFGETSSVYNRLLFWQDALPVILRHPFGLGYMGYYFLQGSFQTGLYSAMFIHNEALQILLDVGWIPSLLLAGALVRAFVRGDGKRRILLLFFLLHSMMDFDLQFTALGFLLALLMDQKTENTLTLSPKAGIPAGIVLMTVCLYFGSACALQRGNRNQAAAELYPGETLAQLALLKEEKTADSMEARADVILRHNRSVSLAWSAKARAAAAQNEYVRMMEYKEEAIRLAKYSREEYLDYIDMLYQGLKYGQSSGDHQTAALCLDRLRGMQGRMKKAADEISTLGRKVPEQPDLTLPPEYAWLEGL